jgi:N-acetyltransferase
VSSESFVLSGNLVRLEPLELSHAAALAAASAADPILYQWSPVPQGIDEAAKYIATAIEWQQAGTAVPFAIVR